MSAAVTQEVSLPSLHPTRVKLEPKQEKEWEITRAAFFWQFPAFAHVFYKMMADGKDRAIFTKDVPIAATDGNFIMINPDTFFNYSLGKRLFALAHEICHGIFDHMGIFYRAQRSGKVVYADGSELPYDHPTMNIAADLVINDILVRAGAEIDKGWLHNPQLVTAEDSVFDSYKKTFKQKKGNGGNGGDGCQPGQSG